MTENSRENPAIHTKSLARLMAVQGLYNHLLMGEGDVDSLLERVLETHKQPAEEDSFEGQKPNKKFLKKIIKGCLESQEELDAIIKKFLKDEWKIERLDPLLLSILRAATYELRFCPGAPLGVVLDEYINVTHAFYDMAEVGFVNGILDSIAHELRPDEKAHG